MFSAQRPDVIPCLVPRGRMRPLFSPQRPDATPLCLALMAGTRSPLFGPRRSGRDPLFGPDGFLFDPQRTIATLC